MFIFKIQVAEAQYIDHYPEITYAPNTNTPIYGWDVMYLNPKKGSIGGWSFVYADKKSAEIVVGPSIMKKNFRFGIGGGYEFISNSPVVATFVNYFNDTREVYVYIERGRTWYWYQILLNQNFGHKNQWIVGLYSQTTIGTGVKFGYKFNKKFYISTGLGYAENHLTPVLSLGAILEKNKQ